MLVRFISDNWLESWDRQGNYFNWQEAGQGHRQSNGVSGYGRAYMHVRNMY